MQRPISPNDEQDWLPYPFRSLIQRPSIVREDVRVDFQRLQAGDFEAVLKGEFAKPLFNSFIQEPSLWYLRIRDTIWQTDDQKVQLSTVYHLIIVGLALFNAFIQSNVTGPPLPIFFSPGFFLSDDGHQAEPSKYETLKRKCRNWLAVDGITLYPLITNTELFWAAICILDDQFVKKLVKEVRWPRLQICFLHQRMLSEVAPSLQAKIFDDLKSLEDDVFSIDSQYPEEARVCFLLERAAINTFHGFDSKARQDLDRAAERTGFQFALTGLLGKRTKFQQKETSQLVVLAKSSDALLQREPAAQDGASSSESRVNGAQGTNAKPTILDLNDDTLLEAISFSKTSSSLPRAIDDEASLPQALTILDPSNQPILKPLDAIILLSLASSITNTSPADGLTREETLPYATRVLEGGSSNWQIYTQALLVRSRIEGYRSRTAERGVLQLHALVDQVIAETTPDATDDSTATTFLPRPKPSEAAPVTERLQYIHQLCSPTRWELEAELAARWVSLGGLRTALEIYERLQTWAEAALCWAAVEREDKARKIIRKQLFHSTKNPIAIEDEEDTWEGPERDPPPPDAPRLYCILGDIDKSPSMYERAWSVSNNRYSRAQRSLGRDYFSAKDYPKAAEAYEKSLHINRLDHATWFALGCVRLELQQWDKAVDAFSRTVQLDDQDAEAWSNLAAALLRLETNIPAQDPWPNPSQPVLDDEDDGTLTAPHESPDPQRDKRDALAALSRASRLKYTSYRIWENLLIVAASLKPPSYTDIVIAQKRLIELRGPSVGEKCIDEEILELLVRHIITSDLSTNDGNAEGYDASKPGLQRMVVELVEKDVIPLITTSPRLWLLVAKLALWRNRPSSALAAHEKAWRAVISRPDWEDGTEKHWGEVVDATIELVDAYESLGEMERTEGLGGGEGEVVARDWRFKARSAVRGVLGRGRGSWEGTEGWRRLGVTMEALKVG